MITILVVEDDENTRLLTEAHFDVRIDIWTHFMRECIINYVH